MHPKFKTVIVLLTTAALSGCGFTLRGSAELPPELRTLVLESPDGNPEILRDMRRALVSSDVTLLDEPGAGVMRLAITDTNSTERVLSVNANARAGEYELQVSITFLLRDGGTVVAGPEVLTVERVYVANPERAVAKQEERELMEEEMRRDLVTMILRRLQGLEI